MALVDHEPIELSSDDEQRPAYVDRRAILSPAVASIVSALGGLENGEYAIGHDALGCLRDLKRLWRKDDTDDDRTVARLLWESRVLPNDLIPIVLQTAGKGFVEDKRAVAALDLLAAMTWPIDVAVELKELDEEDDEMDPPDFTQLLEAHLYYKASLLLPDVLKAIVGIMVPCLAKSPRERTERDSQILHVALFLIRNLLFIRDPPPMGHLSSARAELSDMQSRLLVNLAKTNMTDIIITLASNGDNDPLFDTYNTLLLEIFYLMSRGVAPHTLVLDQNVQARNTLHEMLAAEEKARRANLRHASTRHSRFGTTLTVRTGSEAYVLRRQQALQAKKPGEILDLAKKAPKAKHKTLDELSTSDNLSTDARLVLRDVARTFIQSCFNPFLEMLLKDIRSERPKVTEKDNLRLLCIMRWYLAFFLSSRSTPTAHPADWSFALVLEVVNASWPGWILRRMRMAVEEKPKQWTELQAGLEALTQLLQLIDGLSGAEDEALKEAGNLLQQQLYYNGEVLDMAFESLRAYKEQSIAYLDASVHFSYILLRMLEKFGKARGDGFVRQKRKKTKGKKGTQSEDQGVPDVEDDEEPERDPEAEHAAREQMMTFEKFEVQFANEEVTSTLLVYLARWRSLSSDQLKRVVSLLHRQAVRAHAEGLFFKVTTLDLFRSILADEPNMPKEQTCKDFMALVRFLLRQFFKAMEKEPFLIIEAFFPKNRGHWKAFSSFQPPVKEAGGRTKTTVTTEVKVKKGFMWSQEVGIAIACLVEAGQRSLIEWTMDILRLVIGTRQRLIEETDGSTSPQAQAAPDGDADDEEVREHAAKLHVPSQETMSKLEDYFIPYVSEEQAEAATKNAHLKLLFRLIQLFIIDDDPDTSLELQWYAPASIMPSEYQRSLNVINGFLEKPIDLEGKKPSQLVTKQRKRTFRPVSSDSESDGEADYAGEDAGPRKDREGKKSKRKSKSTREPKERKEMTKKKKEEKKYKSAQFILDSDAELDDDEAFWAREKERRERAAAGGVGMDDKITTMRTTGTRKRRAKKDGEKGVGRKKRKSSTPASAQVEDEEEMPTQRASTPPGPNSDSEDSDNERSTTPLERDTPDTSPPSERLARPRPNPRKTASSPGRGLPGVGEDEEIEPVSAASPRGKLTIGSDDEMASQVRRKPRRLVLSDDEE